MKRKVKVTLSGKSVEGFSRIRDSDHFEAQLRFRPAVYAPKKGKGSFRRHEKHPKRFF